MQEFKFPSPITINTLRELRLSLVKREIPPDQSKSCQPSALHFPLKSAGTVYDLGIILARGLDQMIAALAIWEAKHRGSDAVNKHQLLDEALKNFFNKLVEINNRCNLNAEDKLLLAKKSLKTLTSECLTHLGMKNIDIQTFLTVRDIVYKEYFGFYSVSSDIYSQEPGSESTKLGTVVYQPIDFSKSTVSGDIATEQYKSALKDPKKDTNDTRNSWVGNFLKTRGDNLKTLSMTPMTRVAALPANAYKMTYQSKQNIANYPSFYSMAFAVPFKIKDKSERDNSTKLNLQLMLTDQSVLLETAQAFRDRWQPVVNQSGENDTVITLPLTYQTLVTRIWLPGMPDYNKSPRGLEEIASSLDSLKTDLAEKQYVLHENQNGEEVLVEYIQDKHINQVKYQFDLLSANTCINRYHKISAERERDYQAIKTLLDLTKAHIERELSKKDQNNNNLKNHLDTVKSFLDKPDTSYFTPYLSRGRAVKEALTKISQSNEQLGLLLSAAVELKVCSHETVFGSLRRQALDKVQPRWLQQMLRVLSFILASLIKIPVAPVLLSHWLKHHNSRRKMFYRAAYLNIVAAQLGRSVSSCMSSADRQKELDSFIAALVADFEKNKKLLGFNDSVKNKINFIKKYQLSANQIKRNIARIATGSPSTQDNELLPFFKQFGSRAGLFVEHSQKELNKIVKSLRYAKSALVVKLAGITMAQAFRADASNSSGPVTLVLALTHPKSDSLNFPEIEFVFQNKDSQPPLASNKVKWGWIIMGGLLLGTAAGLMFGTGGLGLVAIPLGVLLKCLLVKLGLAVFATSSASVFVAAGVAALLAGLNIYWGMHTEESTQSLKV